MIEMRMSISSDLMQQLDILDRDVKVGLRDGVRLTCEEAYKSMQHKADYYDWKPPRTTGNLKNTIGYLVAGGGKFNIYNYNATRSMKKAFDAFSLPERPTDPYSGVIFALASYAAFQEFGTVHHGAKPFFYGSVEKEFARIDYRVLGQILRRNLRKAGAPQFEY